MYVPVKMIHILSYKHIQNKSTLLYMSDILLVLHICTLDFVYVKQLFRKKTCTMKKAILIYNT